ncbi:MAG: hypothetical protein ACPG9N_04600 [Miltoncostaeaceae bacterium]|jgi:hypothetical protein
MAEYTPGRGTPTGAAGRDARHAAALGRWPVIAEPWAQRLEARRVEASVPDEVSPAARVGANAAEQGITPLQAINRALGLPDDHGVDEVQRRRGDLG